MRKLKNGAGRSRRRSGGRWTSAIVTAAILAVAHLSSAIAGEVSREELGHLFPAEQGRLELGPAGGSPGAAEVRHDGALIGYALSTADVAGSVGFSGRPLDVHVGLTLDGRIAGARLAAHEEPILVIGISPQALEAFVAGLAGLDIRQPVRVVTGRKSGAPDHVAGATVSSTVIRDVVVRSARAVAASRGLLGGHAASRRIDQATFAPKSFAELVEAGAVVRRVFRRGDIGLAAAPGQPADAMAIELFLAVLTPPAIRQNLLGRREFERLGTRLSDREHAILIAANGLYSFKGTAWRQTGVFDRFQLVQGANTIRSRAEDHDGIAQLAAEGAPPMREIGIFRIPAASGFDPTEPWRLEVTLESDNARGQNAPAVARLDYRLPEQFLVRSAQSQPEPGAVKAPAAPGNAAVVAPAEDRMPELWEQIWRARKLEIAGVVVLLVALTAILFSHDLLVRDVARYRAVRLAFLGATLLYLGFYTGAQLSVVHVVTFAHALLRGFRWEQFLLDPLIFILWSFVALALLFWGRGVFCGWLCPFGALQELLNEAARKLGIRQIEVPWALHERLWPIKYVAFLLILGVSLKSASQAFVLAEVEPFKTTITLWLMRTWPFVLYAIALLSAGLFIERFYCRYLCPLGAALAIPARLRLFEWLKRRPQCGRECRICATSCAVQAINPLGQIVPNECIYCLQCQANYYDAKTCLPLIQRAQRRPAAPARPAFPAATTEE